MLFRLVPLLLLAVLAGAEESLDEKVSATDFTSADAVFALASWCKEHRMPTKAQQYYNQVLRIDKDHEQARAALGFVRVGDRWVNKAFAPPGSGQPAAGAEEPPAQHAAVPGPTAAQIQWDLTVPTSDPEPGNPFITKYIDRLPRVANDSNDMDVSVATCITAKNWPSAMPRLCKALLRDDFTDLYGAASMVLELARQGRLDEAKPLLPFLVKASGRVTDADDLSAFCMAAGAIKDRRAVPRLIELMEAGGDVGNAATAAVARIAAIPAAGLTPEKAKDWWGLNHNVSERESAHAQLRSSDPATALEAAKALLPYRDNAIIPALPRLLRCDDLRVRLGAVTLLKKITGDDWGFDPSAPAESRDKIADHLEGWWKDEKDRFHWPEDAKAPAAVVDPNADWVLRLDSTEGNKAQDAESRLRERGLEAVPTLISGLSTPSSIVRRKCNDLLKEITGQESTFDARGSDEERAKAVEAWKAWWQAHRPAAPAPAPAPAPKPDQPRHEVP